MKKITKSVTRPLPPELTALESVVGQFMEYWGFKNIHGRIWTHLYTAQGPLDSLELMKRLGVSKGLMSLAIRDLLRYDVIKSNNVGKHGTVFYVANPDLFAVITGVLRQRETEMLSQAHACASALKKIKKSGLEDAGLNAERIQSVLDLTESAQSLLKVFLLQDEVASDGAIFRII